MNRLSCRSGLIALLLLGGCQAMPTPEMSGAVHWYRGAAEKRAIYEQTYAWASHELQAMAKDLAPGTWGVILDVDETVLDNSEYQKEHPVYSDPTWDAWTARKAAIALPGAVRFTTQVRRELGGLVVLVTNRDQKACADTGINLQRAGIGYDRILCRTTTSDKNPRFSAVQTGAADTPAVNVLMWIGDNIQDFPSLNQQNPDLSAFGVRYFALPNPMYGSWTGNPKQ